MPVTMIAAWTSRYHAGDAVGALARSVNVSVRVDDQADIAQTAGGWPVLIAGMIALLRDVIVRGALIVEQTVTLHAQ